MATTAYPTKSMTNDFQKYKEQENRRSEGLLHRHLLSSNPGSIPKRYQSVFTDRTPLTSFGLRNGADDDQRRSHSPPNRLPAPIHQRPLKPVKEFLHTQAIVDQQLDSRRRSSPHTNGHSRLQTDATVQNVNAALTKAFNKLRQEPLNTATANARSTALYTGPTFSRPMTSRATSRQNPNFYYQSSGGTKGPLPTELITRRPTNSSPSNNPSNGVSHNRLSNGTDPLIGQQPMGSMHYDIRSTDTQHPRASTPFRMQTKSVDTDLQQIDGFSFDSVMVDEYPDRFTKSKQIPTRSTTSKQTLSPHTLSADNQHRSLPEVSVNPHIQSSVQKNDEQVSYLHESLQNGFSNDQIYSSTHENRLISRANTNENLSKHHRHHHHHIQVEPKDTFKRAISPPKHQQIADVQPAVIVQHQRSTAGLHSKANIVPPSAKAPLNEAYIERNNSGAQLLTTVNTHPNENNDSTSTLKYYENQEERKRNEITPPASPATQELNRIWKKQKNKYPVRSATAALADRRTSKAHRPPGRLKNYGDESDTETTATETQSKDVEMARRHTLAPSDLGSDAWSDLTSEFSDTKFRKHPQIRTSTPNMTRQSSSQSSKEVGQIRKQLVDLQIMYNDLLKLLDIDIESMRSSHKSSTSSQADHNSRRHRFRKVMPVTSMRHSNLDMREVNQRFTRIETSIVTLAESIAKLSAQIQMQRTAKDDVQQLRQEVAELRQQIHYQHPRHQSSTPTGASGIPSAISHQPTRLISPNIQRLPTITSANPSSVSTSHHPSPSTIQRSTSIIDPRQARKIEQFFGTEAMLRYFLSLLNYEEYAPVLERDKIGIYELPYVSERKLQSLGIPYGPCARIIHEAQQYFISLLTLKSSGIDV